MIERMSKYGHLKMQCSTCKKVLDKSEFSFKNVDKRIYYQRCDHCRKKDSPEKKERDKECYELTKKLSTIHCKCGSTYVAFRDFHIRRHLNTPRHLAYTKSQNNRNDKNDKNECSVIL